MIRFSTKAIATAAAGVTLAGAGVTTALAYGNSPESASSARTAPASSSAQASRQAPEQTEKRVATSKDRLLVSAKKDVKAEKKKAALPGGISTATSFWDASTASGKPMSYHTIASPYWPLGTKVKVTYNGKSEIGVVEDFGPAEWAVAQHNPPALIDLSEKMMQHLTGTASNSVTIKFQVLELGKGGVYRHSGTGYATATGKA